MTLYKFLGLCAAFLVAPNLAYADMEEISKAAVPKTWRLSSDLLDDTTQTGLLHARSTQLGYAETEYADAETAEGENHGHHSADKPIAMDPSVREIPYNPDLFGSDPVYPDFIYDPKAQLEIYGGKTAVKTARPLLEIGRDLYNKGPLGEGTEIFGRKNRTYPQILAYGDVRTAMAYNDNQGVDVAQVAARINLDMDLILTSTERIHMFLQPINDGGSFTRFEFGGGNKNPAADPVFEFNLEPVTLFFEGDLGAIMAGITDEYVPYDRPITFGRVPLLMQNGIWIEDAFLGGATSITAKNSPKYDISNFDVTFFAGLDEVTSDAFLNSLGGKDDHDAKIIGAAGFIEFGEGYMETGYAYAHDADSSDGDFSYHNATIAFTKRYGGKISNSTRVIANFGQSPGGGISKTADGVLILSENSLVSHKPLVLVPYANFWVGLGKTQSLARNNGSGGVLRNTGLSFESDGLTGFPTLDATAVDTLGGSVGVEYLFNLEQQIVGEVSLVLPHSKTSGPAKKPQMAVGVRYQRPLNNALIFRADTMYGHFDGADPAFGLRFELRRKF